MATFQPLPEYSFVRTAITKNVPVKAGYEAEIQALESVDDH